MLKFLAVVLGVSGFVLGLALLARQYHWVTCPTYFYEILAFTSLTTLILFSFLHRVKQPGMFIQLYLLSMVVKLLGSGIFIFIVALKDKAGAASNAGFFLFSYILYTALEVGFLYRQKSSE